MQSERDAQGVPPSICRLEGVVEGTTVGVTTSQGRRTSGRRARKGAQVFFHTKRFQYNAKPDNPDPIFAKQMQELLGGQWGEISVMMTYLFQGWNCRGPAKYRDMLLDTATEEIGHVEMIATMIARLLETSPRGGRGSCLRRRGRGGRPGRGRHPGGHHQRGDEPPACHRHRT